MLRAFREMFDLMTFYKPVQILAEEGKSPRDSLAAIIGVYLFFAIAVFAINFALAGGSPLSAFRKYSAVVIFMFVFSLVQIPLVSGMVFWISRSFSKKGSLIGFISANFFLFASASMLILVYLIPFATFAGLVLAPLGIVLYLFFLEGLMEKTFGIKSILGLSLLIAYLVFSGVLIYAAFAAAAALQIPVQ